MIEVKDIILMMKHYIRIFPYDIGVIGKFIDLLDTPDFENKDQFPSHLTASVWLTNREHNKALMVFQPDKNQWVQPCGHIIAEDKTIEMACKRLLLQLTGLSEAMWKDGFAMDLEIHKIPKTEFEPKHEHYEIRLWFITDIEDISESALKHKLKWMSLDEINVQITDESISRMASKTLNHQ